MCLIQVVWRAGWLVCVLIHLILSTELQDAYESKEEEAQEQTALKMSIESDLTNTSELPSVTKVVT